MSRRRRILIALLLALAGAAARAADEAERVVPAPVREAARAALERRLARDGIAATAPLTAAEAVTWPDGSLGCAVPRAAVTAVQVPGYRLQLSAAGRRYEVHASRAGAVALCSPPGPRAAPPPAPRTALPP